jgi:NADH-ubiquinone oxidoreductase MWFE subunit
MPHEILLPFGVMVGLISASGFLLKGAWKLENSWLPESVTRRHVTHRFDHALVNRDLEQVKIAQSREYYYRKWEKEENQRKEEERELRAQKFLRSVQNID